jgi:hypothetical protein
VGELTERRRHPQPLGGLVLADGVAVSQVRRRIADAGVVGPHGVDVRDGLQTLCLQRGDLSLDVIEAVPGIAGGDFHGCDSRRGC